MLPDQLKKEIGVSLQVTLPLGNIKHIIPKLCPELCYCLS